MALLAVFSFIATRNLGRPGKLQNVRPLSRNWSTTTPRYWAGSTFAISLLGAVYLYYCVQLFRPVPGCGVVQGFMPHIFAVGDVWAFPLVVFIGLQMAAFRGWALKASLLAFKPVFFMLPFTC